MNSQELSRQEPRSAAFRAFVHAASRAARALLPLMPLALLVLGAAFAWAIGTLLQKKYPVRAPLAAYTAWLMLLGGVPIYIGALLFEDFSKLADVSLTAALGATYNVLLAFAWAHWAWFKLATSVSVTVFSLCMLVIPVVGVFSGMLFLGEQPGWPEYTALAFVLGSLATVVVPQKK